MASTDSKYSSYKFELPPLPPSLSESLTKGTDIPPPPPSPPPKEEKKVDLNGQRRTPAGNPSNLRSTSSLLANPLSASPAPGFLNGDNGPPTSPSETTNIIPPRRTPSRSPEPSIALPQIRTSSPSSSPHRLRSFTPSTQATAYAGSSPTNNTNPTTTTTGKRPSSVRKFLSFRSLNASYGKQQQQQQTASSSSPPQADHSSSPSRLHYDRPRTPSAMSLSSNANTFTSATTGQHSLRKKRSSLFWGKRKSMMFDFDNAENIGAGGGGMNGKLDEETENVRPLGMDENGGGGGSEVDRNWEPAPKLPELTGVDDGKQRPGFFGGGDIFRDIK
ncbi:hypothetical protein MMC25_007549 [Agyrium rufum]|nr:hypothetical protein [Agyrium rufum]